MAVPAIAACLFNPACVATAAAAGVTVTECVNSGLCAAVGQSVIEGIGDAVVTGVESLPGARGAIGKRILEACGISNRDDGSDEEDLDEICYQQCKHLLPSPSGDLQSSEFRKCFRECKGTL